MLRLERIDKEISENSEDSDEGFFITAEDLEAEREEERESEEEPQELEEPRASEEEEAGNEGIVGNYIKEKMLGQGNFSTVWKARKINDSKVIALKEISLLQPDKKGVAFEELKLLNAALKAPCLPSLTCFYGYFIKNNNLYLKMEYVQGETLAHFADKYRYVKPEKLALYLLNILQDLTPGLKYLHNQGLIHRDIKPENILIDNKNQPKFIDFGLGCLTYITRKLGNTKVKEETYCQIDFEELQCCLGDRGTPYFMSPETLLRGESVYLSDVWSLGASLYKAMTDDYVFVPDRQTVVALKRAVNSQMPPILFSNNIYLDTVIYHMLQKILLDRIDVNQIETYLKIVNELTKQGIKTYPEAIKYVKTLKNEIMTYIFEKSYEIHKVI